jgi:hypothetical protein
MKRCLALAILTAIVILATQGGYVRADPVYFDFQTRLYLGSYAGQNGMAQGFGVAFAPASPGGQGQAEIDAGRGGTHVAGPASINIANLGWQVQPDPSNMGLPGTPSTFNAQPFKLALTLTDETSHAQGTLYFPGTFSLTPGLTSSGILSFKPSIQTLDLGHYAYTVDLGQRTTWVPQQSWMLMGAYGGGYQVSAQVNLQPHSAPEPASLTLAGLGLATVLAGGLRRWRPRKLASRQKLR